MADLTGVYAIIPQFNLGVDDQVAVNVLHYKDTTGTNTVVRGDAIADAYAAAFKAANPFRTLLPATVALTGMKWHGIQDPEVWGERPVSEAPGTGSGHSSSLRIAPVVKKQTAKRGRQYRGRFFLPPLTEAVLASGAMTAEDHAKVQAFATSILTVGGATMGVIQWEGYEEDGKQKRRPLTFEPCSSLIARRIVGSVRTRQVVA